MWAGPITVLILSAALGACGGREGAGFSGGGRCDGRHARYGFNAGYGRHDDGQHDDRRAFPYADDGHGERVVAAKHVAHASVNVERHVVKDGQFDEGHEHDDGCCLDGDAGFATAGSHAHAEYDTGCPEAGLLGASRACDAPHGYAPPNDGPWLGAKALKRHR